MSKIAQGAIDKAIIAAHECTSQALTTDLEGSRAQLASALAANAAHAQALQEMAQKIERLQADAAAQAKVAEGLTAEGACKSLLIKSLQASAAADAKVIEALKAESAGRSLEIEGLEAAAAAGAKKIKSLLAEGAAKSKLIDNLQAEGATNTKTIKSLQADSAAKSQVIESLRAEAATKSKAIEGLQSEGASMSKVVETLQAVAAADAQQMKVQAAQINELQAQLSSLLLVDTTTTPIEEPTPVAEPNPSKAKALPSGPQLTQQDTKALPIKTQEPQQETQWAPAPVKAKPLAAFAAASPLTESEGPATPTVWFGSWGDYQEDAFEEGGDLLLVMTETDSAAQVGWVGVLSRLDTGFMMGDRLS
jgi:hypothetical protein